MHVGDPVAMVVAESAAAAQDAADLVRVEYEELPAVVDLRDAMKAGGTQLYPEAPGQSLRRLAGPGARANRTSARSPRSSLRRRMWRK